MCVGIDGLDQDDLATGVIGLVEGCADAFYFYGNDIGTDAYGRAPRSIEDLRAVLKKL